MFYKHNFGVEIRNENRIEGIGKRRNSRYM